MMQTPIHSATNIMYTIIKATVLPGGGHDWYIASDMTSGYVNLGHDYTCRLDDYSSTRGGYGSNTCRADFSGGGNNGYNGWSIVDIEVWYGAN